MRGYALSADSSFLEPYTAGLAGAAAGAARRLRRLLAGLPAARADLAQVIRLAARLAPATRSPDRQVAATGKPLVSPNVLRGKADFDAIRRRSLTCSPARHAQRPGSSPR